MRAIDADRLLKMMSHWKPYMDMDKVRKAVQNMPTLTPPNEWISVEDTVPDPGERVLATDPWPATNNNTPAYSMTERAGVALCFDMRRGLPDHPKRDTI